MWRESWVTQALFIQWRNLREPYHSSQTKNIVVSVEKDGDIIKNDDDIRRAIWGLDSDITIEKISRSSSNCFKKFCVQLSEERMVDITINKQSPNLFGKSTVRKPIKQSTGKSVGVIKGVPLFIKESDLIHDLEQGGFGKTTISRITKARKPTRSLKVNFSSQELLQKAIADRVRSSNLTFVVEEYNQTSIVRCYKCHQYKHTASSCPNDKACFNCGGAYHGEECTETLHCVNCKGQHPPSSPYCPIYIKLYNAIQTRVTSSIPAEVTGNALWLTDTCNTNNSCNNTKRSNNVPLSQQKHSKVPCLPTLLYTNCRSLNHWKLEELSVYAEIHKPDVICLTETWLDKNKESARQIVNYDNHFCHRKGRLGGGVAILTSNVISCKELCSHTTSTISAIWIKINKEKCAPLIICCIYHPPGASNDSTLEYLSTTTLKWAQKHPTAQFIITGDFNRLPLENYQQQNNLTNLVTFDTRENATLDLMLTDIVEYSQATKLAPIADNNWTEYHRKPGNINELSGGW